VSHDTGMAPLIVLVGTFVAFLALKALGAPPFAGWPWFVGLRGALAFMFLLTASAHWGKRRPDLIRMVPPRFPRPDLLVTFTGIAELAGAVGLLWPPLAPWAASGLILLLLALFPANVHAAREKLQIGGRPVMPFGPRLVVQIVFVAALLVAGFAR
jgi:uncharacterized membrane protein